MTKVLKPPKSYAMGVDQILKFLPHRPPFLMLDRILEIHPNGDVADRSPANMEGTRVEAAKCLSANEPYFAGHFPGFAIFPGVLMIEALAQAASFSIYPYFENELEEFARDFRCALVGVNEARFRRPVLPGETLQLTTTVTKCRGKLWVFDCEASVDGQKAGEAALMANISSSFHK